MGTSEIAPQKPKSHGAGNDDGHGVSQIFSVQQMSTAAQHANVICTQYGVSIVSINAISAVPMDKKLEETLSAGAVAAAGALQAEIAARGNAKARLIDAQSQAAANRINAQAIADAEVTQAQGKKRSCCTLGSVFGCRGSCEIGENRRDSRGQDKFLLRCQSRSA